MSLQPGQQFAHYEILEPIGKGGMGEVYRARDSKLGRDVAIKVLPEELARDTERLERFRREAQVLASLNHPSIASIYGLEESEGTHGLVLELVEGQTLAERISGRPVPVDEAREIARQVAEALEEAHERGIVHRDLKPANVKLTPAGKVKVLDFGLAKTFAEDETQGDGSHSPTLARDATQAGALLGTAPYMSPEQARGQEVDERSDIWSFGCVLWECLTGQKLFGGATLSDSIGAILHADPEWTRLPGSTPPDMRRLLRRCLAKDPRQRLHHIADARIELEDDAPPSDEPSRPTGLRIAAGPLWAMGLIAGLTTVLLVFLWPLADRTDPGIGNPLAGARFTRLTNFEGSEFGAAISPDGRFVAFVSDRDGAFDVFVSQIGTGRFRNITQHEDELGLQDVRAPVRPVGFNGDGSEIWFGGGPNRRMRTVPLLGGPVRNLLGDNVINVEWSPDSERIVYHTNLDGDPVYVADRSGANSKLILGAAAGIHQHYPIWSVDGQWIYLARGRPPTLEMDLWRARPGGGGEERLTERKLDVRYPTPIDERTVLYSARDADGAGPWLWAVDVETGISRRVSVGLEQYASVTASADRRRLVATVQNPRAGLWSVPILDRPATEDDVRAFGDLPTTRALAPRFGGSSLFYLSSQGSGDGLWRYEDGEVVEVWRGSEAQLLVPAAVSADGASVVVLLRSDDAWRLHVLSGDGAQLRLLSGSIDARGAAAWSPDGRWIATGGSEAGVQGLFKIPIDGGAPERIAEGQALDPVWSPDGNLIVYSGPQVDARLPLLAVRPDGSPVALPEIGVLRGGERMRFLPDGSGLVYMQGFRPSQDFWLLDLATMATRRLTRLEPTATMRTFDVTPDGQTIVFDRLSQGSDIVLIELGDPKSSGAAVP